MAGEHIEVSFRYRVDWYLYADSAEELDFEVSFVEGTFAVRAVLEKETSSQIESGELKGRHQCLAKGILFQLSSTDFLQGFQPVTADLVEQDAFKQQIYDVQVRVLNRVLRNLRVYGLAPFIHEEAPNWDQIEAALWLSNSEIRIAGQGWRKLYSKERVGLSSLFAGRTGLSPGYDIKALELDAFCRRDVVEAIEDNLESPPEQEFLVNTLEFLRHKNPRMAVVEAVIGLEIVLTQYISLFLEKKKGLSKTKFSGFIRYEVGLKSRLNVLLRLLVEEKEFDKVNLDLISNLIKWRNRVAHEGSLPEGVSEADLALAIGHAMALSSILRSKIHQIESEPLFQEIVDEVKSEYGLSFLSIYPTSPRKVYMDLTFYLDEHGEDTEEFVHKIIESSIRALLSKRPRFDPKQDFYARIYRFPRPDPIASYVKGDLRFIQRRPAPGKESL